MAMSIYEAAKSIEKEVIKIRRDLHEHPEISMQEERTIRVVTDELTAMNIDYEVVPYGGVIGIIEGKGPGKTIILRADLDALPMKESPMNLNQEKVVVSKIDDAAHTCGHDGHTAMLLGAARILNERKNTFKGKILLAFEQGEENGSGIFRLLRRLVELGADGIWGIHLKSDIPTGKISVDPGPRMAGVFPFHVEINGVGGHGARPDLATSPLSCFHTFYQRLQSIRAEYLNPFLPITYSIGHLSYGKASNVIGDSLQFSGTARFLHEEQGEAFVKVFDQLLKETCQTNNCTYKYLTPTRPLHTYVINDETCAEIAKQSIIDVLGDEALITYPAWMASEPFGLYQKYFPGIFAFVGIYNEEKGTGAEHHNAHFDLDEDALIKGVLATVQYALNFLDHSTRISYKREKRSVEQLFKDLQMKIYDPNNDDKL